MAKTGKIRSADELVKKYQSAGKIPASSGPKGPGGPGGRNKMAGGKPKDTRASIMRLLAYLNPYKLYVLIAFACVLLSTGATLWHGVRQVLSPQPANNSPRHLY